MAFGDTSYNKPVDIDLAKLTIRSDPFMTSYEISKLTNTFDVANSISPRPGVTAGDLATGAAYAATTYAGSRFVGKMLGSMFGVSEDSQKTLSAAGAIAAGVRGLNFF